MGQILHSCARTTEAVRRAIQNSKESLKTLSERYSINHKTVTRWRKRDYVHDAPMGPKNPHSTVLSREEEAVCVAFRRHTLLPLDDCLYSLQESIPHLTRSSLHRLFQRHSISRLPELNNKKKEKKKFKSYPIGYFHVDIAEVRTEEGKLYLFVAIDRTSKFVYVELLEKQGKMQAAQFLRNLVAAVPYKIHTILTDNGQQFTNLPHQKYAFPHIFNRVCEEHNIEHRLTQPAHPWTNGQVERMNKTIKEATVKRYYYSSHDKLHEHMKAFICAYNFAKRLKTLKGLTPYEFIVNSWENSPQLFKINPFLLNMGP
ncbi:MAG: IS481 family transposase, partial [Holosporaceae bacterium]|nr:IS481 family transposase [Holosporaceae bacterium]